MTDWTLAHEWADLVAHLIELAGVGVIALGAVVSAGAALIQLLGRRPWPGEKMPRRVPDLLLDDQNPFRLSRQHFVIDSAHGRLVVRDLDSSLGTLVNGEPIGSHFRADVAELRPGPNRIVAGGFESDFAFTALVG